MEAIRHVRFDGYTLKMWDTNKRDDRGQTRIRYEMRKPDGALLFEGADFSCSPMHADDSDESVRALLGFLTLRPGDTDDEYFENYTDEQRAFCDSDAEELSMWSMEADDDHPAMAFEDLPLE